LKGISMLRKREKCTWLHRLTTDPNKPQGISPKYVSNTYPLRGWLDRDRDKSKKRASTVERENNGQLGHPDERKRNEKESVERRKGGNPG